MCVCVGGGGWGGAGGYKINTNMFIRPGFRSTTFETAVQLGFSRQSHLPAIPASRWTEGTAPGLGKV